MIAVFHIKFISSVLKINDLLYQIAGQCDSTLFGMCILIPQFKYITIIHRSGGYWILDIYRGREAAR